jgi:leader peptidase (prepilin peptidase) / N-methyltransferase
VSPALPVALATASAGVLGALIGSFLNVVVHRLPRGESLVRPRSRCPSCRAEIAAYDNVPVLSWLALRGRCRSCRASISPRYPAVELVTALTFVAIVLLRGFDAELLLALPFAAVLLAVAGTDLEHRIVPNRVLAPAAIYAVVATVAVRPGELTEALVAGAGAFLFLLVAALAYPGGMGMGDVKLAGVMGLYLGFSILPALAVAFITGSVVGVALIARYGTAARKRAVPFAPFLALGGLVGLLAGAELIALYTGAFLN